MTFSLKTNAAKWTDTIDDLKRQLQVLNNTAETEFLAVGSKIHEIFDDAKQISDACAEIATLLTGNATTSAIEGLKKLLDNTRTANDDAEQLAQRGESELTMISAAVAKVYTPIKKMKNIVRSLNILGVVTRIENASLLNDAGINSLAGDVNRLANVTDEKSKRLIEQVGQLQQLIQITLSDIGQIETSAHEKTLSILEKTHESLSAFAAKQHESQKELQTIANLSEQIRAEIGTVVASIQFHDITRQQIEHAIGALETLSEKFRYDFAKARTEQEKREAIHHLEDVCELQKAQIQQSQESILGGIRGMTQSLSSIAKRTSDFSGETHKLTGATYDLHNSFLAQIENDLMTISNTMSTATNASADIAKATIAVADLVATMSGFLKAIEDMGKEIELIAINAIVKASHIGNEGAALKVSAQSIERLSVTSRKDITMIANYLKEVSTGAGQLKSSMESGTTHKQSGLQHTVVEINQLLANLRQIGQQVGDRLCRIDENAARLRSKIETNISRFTIHRTFEKVLGQVAAGLAHISHDTNRLLGTRDISSRVNRLK